MERGPPKSERVPGAAGEVELGSVTGVFGFRGELRLHLHNPESDLLRVERDVILVAPDGTRRPGRLRARPGAGNRVLGRLDGVDSEAGAAALRGFRILVSTAALPELPEGEFYVWQLEGAEVRIDGARVGEVRGVQHAGPNDVLEIALDEGGEERFVPMLGEFVRGVDAAARVVELVPGALEEG